MNNHELKHFGIPGMKWGVRKSKVSSGSDNKKGKPDLSEDHVYTRKLLATNTKYLSNAELKALNNRLDMEQKISQYKGKTKRSEKVLNTIKGVTAAGTTIASLYALSNTQLFKDAKSAIEFSLKKANGG